MARPALLLSFVVALGAAAPASADAADPLLSGYAGPGGGDQAILGETLLPAAKGNGSLRAAPVAGAPVPAPGAAAAPGASGASGASGAEGGVADDGASGGTGGPGSSSSGSSAAAGSRSGDDPDAEGTPANRSARPGATPASGNALPAADVGRGSAGFPLGRDELLAALLALGALAGIAFATSRLARGPVRA